MNDELKNADEIVRALRCCGVYDDDKNCGECPICATEKVCCSELMPQAAALIDSLTAQLAESQRREKAAVEDINLLEDCGVCKHHDLDSCDLAGTKCQFEWRGPQEAEKGVADGN